MVSVASQTHFPPSEAENGFAELVTTQQAAEILAYQEAQASAHRDALVATTDLVTELPSSEYFKSIRKRVAAQRKTAQSEMVSLRDGE